MQINVCLKPCNVMQVLNSYMILTKGKPNSHVKDELKKNQLDFDT